MVTIIGGGIAGTVLAGALARDGVSVTVYERRAAVGAGAFLVLDGRTHETLAELGVSVADLQAVSHSVDGLAVHEVAGTSRVVPGDGRRMYFRPDLMRVLTGFAAATPADLRYDCLVTDFDDGTIRVGDQNVPVNGPLIAADGIDSMVRARLEPERPAAYAHQVVVYGVTNTPVPLPSEIVAEGAAAGDPWRGLCLVIEKLMEVHALARAFTSQLSHAAPRTTIAHYACW
jgi:2-polyprenyl-6-methoxyphenol hydroxylase-like FAD-dependent oxidoreductase